MVIAASNRAFEYWFILHYERTCKPMSIKELITKLSSYISEKYKKVDKICMIY